MSKDTRTKSERFKQVCGARVLRACEAIELIGNCAVPTRYEWTPEYVAKLCKELRDEVDKLEKAFDPPVQAQRTFSFDDEPVDPGKVGLADVESAV